MEQEAFFSGYCRVLDASRTVAAEKEDGKLTFVDCNYPDCPHAPVCPIAKELETFQTA